jgi:hypothetical protein
VIGGVRQKMHIFFMDLPHSDAPFKYYAGVCSFILSGALS